MHIAIVEDCAQDRDLFATLLSEYMNERGIELHLTSFENGDDFLRVAVPDLYDVCFFDIYLNCNMTGMETARRFVEIDPDCCIFFLSSSPEFMAEGYDVRAWRYLLKPITRETLSKAMTSCLEKVVLHKRRLEVVINRKLRHIPFSHIQYVSTEERRTYIRTLNDTLMAGIQASFAEVTAPLLQDFRFVTIGKGQVVNLAQVRDITGGELRLRSGERLFISRRHLSAVSERFVDFRLNNS